jgi:ubiquitin carboxyl-terminal hydrolase L3
MVPGPVLAVLLLFPITAESENARAEDEKLIKTYPVDPTVLWIKQTVCIAHSWSARDAHDISRSGTHAVQWDCASHATLWRTSCQQGRRIHALANTNVVFGPQSPLEKFIEACQGKYVSRATRLPVDVQVQKRHPRNAPRCSPAPATRSLRTDVPPPNQFLETTSLFADIHSSAASGGQTAVPADLNTDLHFTCFVQAPAAGAREQQMPVAKGAGAGEQGMRLVELDGRRSGPIDRGACNDLLRVRITFDGRAGAC